MNEIYKIAVDACCCVYKNNKSIGTTQYQHYIVFVKEKKYQAVVFAGTNELEDNVRNLNIFWSKKGIKIGSYDEAIEVMDAIKLYPNLPIIVTGHSKGGASAIAFFLLFCNYKKDYCIVFNPARCLRYWRKRKISNIIMFIDPDDVVSELLGIINFGLPICKTITAKEDHIFYSISDHAIKKMKKFIYNYKEEF